MCCACPGTAGGCSVGAERGVPLARELVRDVLASARAHLVTTLGLALVLATVCFAILVTTGQSAANEARVVADIDSAGTRLIAISDDGGASGILPTAPAAIAAISDVSWSIGLGASVDVQNPALPTEHAGSRVVVGELPSDFALIQGRLPRPGEAIAGSGAAVALRLGPGLGSIEESGGRSQPFGVVGVFTATGPLAHLNDVVLIAAEPGEPTALRYLYVMASDVSVVDRLESVLATSTPAATPSALIIEAPAGAIAVREVVAGRLGAASRQLMAVVMGVGAVITAATMLSATVARRRDLGRRRALGASRSALVATLLGEAGVGALLGIAVGTGAGIAALAVSTGSLPTWQFVTGVAGLVLLLTLAASAPIAIHAAHRDPLRILRVP